ncbi:MAG TPA: universal stress protein [Flavobacteriales bacterium]|nr:universal stress protein [Flavobacteriales bacterium]HRN37942.1 universal stress protein [Flavobacteriales bacterium]HRO39034.1 universal stress protein [Flavobacteriales bacterium]HRP81013.1 universal stress protein [Flavobacteriales bacterium]HRQ85831.1 universal stress protein [Flavobacteriales bacterium]
MSTQKRILVPTDFTKVADCAMNHAAALAERMGADLDILHIVARQNELEEAREKVKLEVERAKRWSSRIKVKPQVRVGSVYDEIGNTASEIGAELIIMGTHGMRGMQFVTGSRALRVITNGKVPFIVVQERNIRENGYGKIVVPMDLQRETRQKVALVAEIAQYFNSKVYVITPRESDEFLHRQLENNIRFAEQYFGERNVELEATIAEVDSSKFVEAVIQHAMKVDADLITIMNLARGNIFGVLGVPYEQEVITNEAMIPVMLLNPRESVGGSGWSFQ